MKEKLDVYIWEAGEFGEDGWSSKWRAEVEARIYLVGYKWLAYELVFHDGPPPMIGSAEDYAQTDESSEASSDTGDKQNTAPEQSGAVLDRDPVRRMLRPTRDQWELVMEALHLLKAKVDKLVSAHDHVSKLTQEGMTRKAVEAAHGAHLTTQENLAIMILEFDPYGEFKA